MSESEKKRSGGKNVTSSIARRINASVWLDKLESYVFLNVAILAALFVMLVLYSIGWTPAGDLTAVELLKEIRDMEFTGDSLRNLVMEIHFASGEIRTTALGSWIEFLLPVGVIVTAGEGIDLFTSLFGAHKILKKLRPLDEIVARATAISKISLDQTKIEHLEEAIRTASTQDGQVHLSTGDSDLRKVESALNQLLLKMEDSYRQQTRFVSDASHELRTPIAVIQGYADMLDRWGKEDPEILQEGITSIKNESQHMKELVEQLLFLARGDSGRNTLHKEKTDLRELIAEVWEESSMIDPDHEYVVISAGKELRAGADEASSGNITLPAAPPAFVEVDVSMVKQSARIFVQNAAKYSEPGSTIRLSVNSSGGKVSYTVEDEGSGIGKEDLKHIFERFYRSDKARNSDTGGTGLGLSIAKWIVDAHDGSIDVTSRPDFGSRFVVSFPAA